MDVWPHPGQTATAMIENGLDNPEVQRLGRWAGEQSCRLYVRLGAAALSRLRGNMDPKVRARLDFFSGSWLSSCQKFLKA